MLSIVGVMILRVYAMWNRSKWILFILLFVCVPQVIISFILAGIYYIPNSYFSGMSRADLHVPPQFHVANRSSLAIRFSSHHCSSR